MIRTDPRDSPECWSRAEVMTPDAIIRKISCGRKRHRWGRHSNDNVTWKCPKNCGCVRHAKGPLDRIGERRPGETWSDVMNRLEGGEGGQ